jgi:hypothetical protein
MPALSQCGRIHAGIGSRSGRNFRPEAARSTKMCPDSHQQQVRGASLVFLKQSLTLTHSLTHSLTSLSCSLPRDEQFPSHRQPCGRAGPAPGRGLLLRHWLLHCAAPPAPGGTAGALLHSLTRTLRLRAKSGHGVVHYCNCHLGRRCAGGVHAWGPHGEDLPARYGEVHTCE